jgi:hypothetical protein
MPGWELFTRIQALYICALPNVVAVVIMLLLSNRFLAESNPLYRVYVESIAWFGIALLFCLTTSVLFHAKRLFYRAGWSDDLTNVALPVVSVASLFFFVLGIWQAAPLIAAQTH